MADISSIVKIDEQIDTGGIARRDFGRTLFVTPDTTLGSSDRLKVYADIAGVALDFATTSEPYKAANIYFAQTPFPKNLLIGRWFKADSAAELIGGTLPTLTTIQAVVSGSLRLNAVDVSGMDFSSALSYADVATTLEAAIDAAGFAVSVVFDALTANFIITTDAVGVDATLTYASPTGSGTDVSQLFALDSDTATRLNQGVAAESIETAMGMFESINDTFYFITLDAIEKDSQTVIDLSTWVFDRPYMFIAESSDELVKESTDLTSIFYALFQQQSERTVGDWTPAQPVTSGLFTDYLALSTAARASSVNFDGVDTIINMTYRQRPLIDTSDLTATQSNVFDSKRVNRYVPVGGGTVSQTISDIYLKGYTFANSIRFMTRFGVDWFKNALQVACLNLLMSDPTLSQVPAGQATVKQVVTSVCNQAVINGFLAPGQVTSATQAQIIQVTGATNFDGTLPAGFLIFPQPISQLTEQEKIGGKSGVFYVWATGSGKIDFIEISLRFTP